MSEQAAGTGLTKRAVQFLSDENLLPPGGGVRTLKRAATIGGFVIAGVPLMVAGRLAEALRTSSNNSDGEMWSGLPRLYEQLPDGEKTNIPIDASDYDYHRILRQNPSIYQVGKAHKFDFRIEIVDRSLVFLTDETGIAIGNVPERYDAAFCGWITGWERGEATTFVDAPSRVIEVIGGSRDRWSEETWAKYNDTLSRYAMKAQRFREDAIGKLTVNVSLAIRLAFDRIADYRTPLGEVEFRNLLTNAGEDW